MLSKMLLIILLYQFSIGLYVAEECPKKFIKVKNTRGEYFINEQSMCA